MQHQPKNNLIDNMLLNNSNMLIKNHVVYLILYSHLFLNNILLNITSQTVDRIKLKNCEFMII